jgi:CubicO group peptidase (beta-lactamase class C family)
MALMLALDSGRISLDDYAARYIPQWRDDPAKSTITIRQLASHCAGLDDVNLVVDAEGRLVQPLEGWKTEYSDNSKARFAMALARSRVIYPPGSEYSYSGMGYYPLAYALAACLRGSSVPDVRSLLERRLMDPLGIPEKAWILSYGEETRQDGLKLYAIGSGAGFTARATARIGQFMLNRGSWDGRSLVEPSSVDAILGGNATPPPNRIATFPEPQAALGWWINRDGFWPSLPRDAYLNAGADHQMLLVVPSLDLVVVRFGGPLAGAQWEGTFWTDMEPCLFAPLMATLAPPVAQVAVLDPRETR